MQQLHSRFGRGFFEFPIQCCQRQMLYSRRIEIFGIVGGELKLPCRCNNTRQGKRLCTVLDGLGQ